MKKIILLSSFFLLFFFFSFFSVNYTEARSGCCSHHGGVNKWKTEIGYKKTLEECRKEAEEMKRIGFFAVLDTIFLVAPTVADSVISCFLLVVSLPTELTERESSGVLVKMESPSVAVVLAVSSEILSRSEESIK